MSDPEFTLANAWEVFAGEVCTDESLFARDLLRKVFYSGATTMLAHVLAALELDGPDGPRTLEVLCRLRGVIVECSGFRDKLNEQVAQAARRNLKVVAKLAAHAVLRP